MHDPDLIMHSRDRSDRLRIICRARGRELINGGREGVKDDPDRGDNPSIIHAAHDRDLIKKT